MLRPIIFLLLAITVPPQEVYDRADALFETGDYRQSAAVIEESLPALRSAGDDGTLADCLSLLSISYTRLGAFTRAMEAQQECYELDLKGGDPANISSSLNNLAGICLSLNNLEEAERLIREAISYEEPLGESAALAIRYGMASDILLKRGKADEAIEYARKALEIDSEAGRTVQAAIRQSQLAEGYIETGRLREAKELLDQAASLFSATGNLHSLSVCRQQQGTVENKSGNLLAASNYLREALALSRQTGNLLLQRNLSQSLATMLQDRDPRAAIAYMQDVVALSDSLYQQQTAQKVAELTITNDLANKEKEIAIQRQALRARRHLIMSLLALFAVMLVALVILIRALSLRSRSHALLEKASQIKDQLLILGKTEDPVRAVEMTRLVEELNELGVDAPDKMLTAREREVAELCCEGLLSKEIADRLSISQRTVETHKNNIFRKLGINTTVELIQLMHLNNHTDNR